MGTTPLEKYKLEKITLETEEAINGLITIIKNWFSSTYDKDNFFYKIRPNKFYKRYKTENSLLYSESNKVSDNFMIILNLLELDKLTDNQQIMECLNSILQAIVHVKELRKSCKKDFILDFICKNIRLLDEWHINMVFKFAFHEGDWDKQNIFRKTAIALKKENIGYVLKDEKLFKQLLYENDNEHKEKVDINHMVYLYNFLEPKFQQELKKVIFENLKENTDDSIELWFQSVNEGVADLSNEMPENILTTFEQYFDEIQNLGIDENGEIILNLSTIPSNLTYRFAEFVGN